MAWEVVSKRVCVGMRVRRGIVFNIFFFFNDTATTEIYTLSLHDALPILPNYQSFLGANETSLKNSEVSGRQTRNLLSKPED